MTTTEKAPATRGGLSASPPAMRNVMLVLAYDGTDFRGFAESDGVRTVMGDLRVAAERVARVPLDLTAAGRTDAGVHGWGQVVTGRLPADLDPARVQHSINRMCAPNISVRAAEWAAEDFDARFSATSRSYRYDVWSDPNPHPSLARVTWHVRQPLDVEAMNAAGEMLLGEHDFASFCRRAKVGEGHPEKSMVRILQRAQWHRVGLEGVASGQPSPLIRFEIAASSFCHQMVRSVVGTLVEVGMGKRRADSLADTLAALDRASAGKVAPPTGLTLWHVGYDGVRWDAVD